NWVLTATSLNLGGCAGAAGCDGVAAGLLPGLLGAGKSLRKYWLGALDCAETFMATKSEAKPKPRQKSFFMFLSVLSPAERSTKNLPLSHPMGEGGRKAG